MGYADLIKKLEKLGLLKNYVKRAELWLILGIIGTLADEWLAEGYLFKFEDLLNFALTHEKIIVTLISALVVVATYHYKQWKGIEDE